MSDSIYNKTSQKAFRRSLRKNPTPAESSLWNLLKNKQIANLRFQRQFGVGPYVLDFYCPQIRLCIELDGEPHYDPLAGDKDHERTTYLISQNIHVLRYENKYVWESPDGIVSQIVSFAENPETFEAENFWR